MQSMLPARVEYVQYAHPVDEVLLQCLEQAGQPVPAMAAFLRDDLAVMIEHVGKHKAPAFKELMVEPKQARAPSQHPQELVWAPVHTVAQLPL
ncbi:hypothetical protein C0995_001711 [Termitomyces sp. Mi166|nr:hypothetical protein C0995_001711 [Termitomyces sp. Mi166\